MKKFKQVFGICVWTVLLVSNAMGQSVELKKFLDAYKTAEFEESKLVLHDYSFDLMASYKMSGYGPINGMLFETDIKGVKGYKAIVTCKIENEANQLVDQRMIIVMYFDKERKRWAVYVIREVVDALYEYNTSKSQVEAGKFYSEKEFVYRNLAYWGIMAGKIQEAKKYIEKGLDEANSKGNLAFTSNEYKVIKAIQ